ncbi:MAG TPA: RNA polymerase factor sigma-54 [Saprospiraceae bacterium]|nr:RNA polymerase factor sigma-54 [Saprospiraceae bacterium]
MLKHNQQLGQKQLLKLSPQQIQLLNFIQLNTLELEQKIRDELEENPALEAGIETPYSIEPFDPPPEPVNPDSPAPPDDYQHNDEIPDYKTASDPLSADKPDYGAPIVQTKDFRELLKDQLTMMSLPPRERLLAGYLVDSLDNDGYLRLPLADVADNLSFAHNIFVTESELDSELETVQGLGPPGIGARDLRECLLLQLEAKRHDLECIDWALQIVDKHLYDLAGHHHEKLMTALGITPAQLKCATTMIEKLNPRPIGSETSELYKNQNIIPEFIVEKTDNGDFRVGLANGAAELHLSRDMMENLEAMRRDKMSKQNKAAVQYLSSKVDSALWFMEMVRQREQSMIKTINALVQLQAEYFRTGDPKYLRPMILKDVAEQVGLDISTISRVTSTKYALVDFGIVHLKDLFHQGMAKTNGELVTNREISDRIAVIIAGEDKQNPLSDQVIAEILAGKGYIVARRTVAKYREAMHIKVAKMRKEM